MAHHRLAILLLMILLLVLSSCSQSGETGKKDNEEITYYPTLEEAYVGFMAEDPLTDQYPMPKATFTHEGEIYGIFLKAGDTTRVAVYAAKFTPTKDGYVINEGDPRFTERYHQDVAEPLDEKLKIIHMEIAGTGMKFVVGKAFRNRYKPYYKGEPYGRMDQNNMFYYAMKTDEDVEFKYR